MGTQCERPRTEGPTLCVGRFVPESQGHECQLPRKREEDAFRPGERGVSFPAFSREGGGPSSVFARHGGAADRIPTEWGVFARNRVVTSRVRNEGAANCDPARDGGFLSCRLAGGDAREAAAVDDAAGRRQGRRRGPGRGAPARRAAVPRRQATESPATAQLTEHPVFVWSGESGPEGLEVPFFFENKR